MVVVWNHGASSCLQVRDWLLRWWSYKDPGSNLVKQGPSELDERPKAKYGRHVGATKTEVPESVY